MSGRSLLVFILIVIIGFSSCSEEAPKEGSLQVGKAGEKVEYQELVNQYQATLVIPEESYGLLNREMFLRQEVIRNLDSAVSGIDKPITIIQDCASGKCTEKFSYSRSDIEKILSEDPEIVELKHRLLNMSVDDAVVLNGLIKGFDKLKGYEHEHDIYELMVLLALECKAGKKNPQNWSYVNSIDSISTIYGSETGLSKNHVQNLSKYIRDSICKN